LRSLSTIRFFSGKRTRTRYFKVPIFLPVLRAHADVFPQNTSIEAKVMVYKRIGQAVLPDLFTLDPNVIADRIKGKLET
jgi:hypothetical protein